MTPVRTWADIKSALDLLTDEQLRQPAQVVNVHPDCSRPNALDCAMAVATVEEMDELLESSDWTCRDNAAITPNIVAFWTCNISKIKSNFISQFMQLQLHFQQTD